MFRALFLDRDGVIIENRADYVRTWSDVQILPGALEALSRVRDFKVVIVTNQSAVGRGLLSLETANAINQQLIDVIRKNNGHIDSVYMCPHSPDEHCACRKPNPGMLLQAAEELSLDISRSWMIGDAWSDLLAGQTAGVCGAAMLRTGRGSDQLSRPRPDGLTDYFVFNDLLEAVSTIQNIDAASRDGD